jgi:cellulose synthase/poly-beta-1,6-N-acetylglucosamine synthase-like glycosyltransferase
MWPLIIHQGTHLLSEALVFLPTVMVSLKTLMARHRPRLQLSGDQVPSVDILVTSCNEPIDVIQDTVLAVLAIDYPRNMYRVIVADDGSSCELEAWIKQLNQPNLYYTSRSIKIGFKAGNLNHAVEESKTLPGGPSDFIAAIDADMIVEKQWLRSVVAHLALDGNLGLVCPSQVSPILLEAKASALKKITAVTEAILTQ